MRLYRSVASLPTTTGTIPHTYAERFLGHVNDDLDTPAAMALVWELLRDQTVSDADKYAALMHFDTMLGLDLKNASHYLTENEHVIPTEELPAEVRALLREREHARKTAQWQRADEYRAQIEALGFDLQDSPSGPKVKRK
jgi:cysteinyl-tRNA synthetase